MKGFPFSAFMMLTALLYFSICSYKNVEGNELAQQKLKPKVISRCSKCSVVSLSVGTSAANPGGKKAKPALKPEIDGRESTKALLLFSPASHGLHSCAPWAESPAAKHCVCGSGRGVGSGCPGAGARLASPAPAAGQPAPAKAPYELCQAGCHASRRVLPSFHPVLPRLHNWLRYYTPCPPCHSCTAQPLSSNK